MKKMILMMVLAISSVYSYSVDAQRIYDYKTETAKNSKERKQMLNLLRSNLKETYRQDFIFQVRELNVSSNGYAWLKVDARRKDGKEIVLDEMSDCCHAEALFRKVKGKWQLVEADAFSTDVWWDGIWDRRKGVSKSLFGVEY